MGKESLGATQRIDTSHLIPLQARRGNRSQTSARDRARRKCRRNTQDWGGRRAGTGALRGRAKKGETQGQGERPMDPLSTKAAPGGGGWRGGPSVQVGPPAPLRGKDAASSEPGHPRWQRSSHESAGKTARRRTDTECQPGLPARGSMCSANQRGDPWGGRVGAARTGAKRGAAQDKSRPADLESNQAHFTGEGKMI